MKKSQHKRPIWLGAVASTFAPWLCVLVVMAFTRASSDTFTDFLAFGALAFVLAFPISLLATLMLGLPYALWLRSRGFFSSLTICVGAAVIGAAAFSYLTWLVESDSTILDPPTLLAGMGFGLVSGVAFCIGAGPNNSFKPTPHRGVSRVPTLR